MSIIKTGSIAVMMSLMLLMIMTITSKKQKNQNQSSSPFECGFTKCNSTTPPFSSQYFLTAILFLIFDLEIVMIMPSPMSENWNQKNSSLILLFLILITMILTAEWVKGGIEWSK